MLHADCTSCPAGSAYLATMLLAQLVITHGPPAGNKPQPTIHVAFARSELQLLLAESYVVVTRCYVTRTSLKCVAPGLSYGPGSFPSANGGDDRRWDQGDDTRVCFQYSAIDAAPVGSEQYKTNDQLYSQLEEDLKAYGAQSVEVMSPPLLA